MPVTGNDTHHWVSVVLYCCEKKQNTASAYFTSKQILPFGFAEQRRYIQVIIQFYLALVYCKWLFSQESNQFGQSINSKLRPGEVLSGLIMLSVVTSGVTATAPHLPALIRTSRINLKDARDCDWPRSWARDWSRWPSRPIRRLRSRCAGLRERALVSAEKRWPPRLRAVTPPVECDWNSSLYLRTFSSRVNPLTPDRRRLVPPPWAHPSHPLCLRAPPDVTLHAPRRAHHHISTREEILKYIQKI